MYKVIKCAMCGKNVEKTHNRTKYCCECAQEKQREHVRRSYRRKHTVSNILNIKPRPLTRDTEYLVCLYSYRGESASSIANCLSRPLSQIEQIIDDVKSSGRYDKHIARHNNLGKIAPTKSYYQTFVNEMT